MRSNSLAVARYAAVLLLLPIMLIGGCEQRNKQQNREGNNGQATQTTQATQEQSGGAGHVRLRVVCADDIQKYCANADKKRRCLRDNIDKLSDACKAAVARRGGRRGRDRNGGGDE